MLADRGAVPSETLRRASRRESMPDLEKGKYDPWPEPGLKYDPVDFGSKKVHDHVVFYLPQGSEIVVKMIDAGRLGAMIDSFLV